MKTRTVQDVSALPTFGYGPAASIWWGTAAFMMLEGTGFVLVAATYLYLAVVNPHWPPTGEPPGLLWSTLLTIALLASAWPNQLAKRSGERADLPATRLNLVVMSAIGFLILALRAMEFTTLNVRWDTNAYGSIVWVILGLHTTHIITDLGDTVVLAVLMFTAHGRGKRFSDVSDNAFYWYFVILTWLPLYLLLYFVPRL
ncbi:MAG: cytochrome c oxidase subunit 3 [Methylobacteriaceae bacterium]|nr:cytochrome c oxidase subunit 3 [Methylobacteriaceae bacterium]MBV9637394.1 cytochrome c oxidase subunit 3 [Methylobacteriaceae bacterium]MBV9703237.1 cytochrome c oxidase subunit 3 [Methylobacteriaceae bacterium]